MDRSKLLLEDIKKLRAAMMEEGKTTEAALASGCADRVKGHGLRISGLSIREKRATGR